MGKKVDERKLLTVVGDILKRNWEGKVFILKFLENKKNKPT